MSDIRFSCPACSKHLVVAARGAGMELACVHCGAKLRVPVPVAEPIPPAPAMAAPPPAVSPAREGDRPTILRVHGPRLANEPARTALPLTRARKSAAHGSSRKRRLPAFLLCVLFGFLGAHRFYAGKNGTAIVQLLTFGGLGLWAFIDLILILAGAFKDTLGRPMTEWT